MAEPLHPDAFDRLKVKEMKVVLGEHNLRVSGNKSELSDRYKAWWQGRSGASVAGPSASSAADAAGPSDQPTAQPPAELSAEAIDAAAAPEPVSVTILEPTKHVHTVPMLERLMVPPKMKVSAVTLECIQRLRYEPGAKYRPQHAEKDFSEVLMPLRLFVEVFIKTLKQVDVSTEMAENETALRTFLPQNMPTVEASVELAPFFRAWNIEVVSESCKSPVAENAELENQLALAVQASQITAQAEAHQLQLEEITLDDNGANAEHETAEKRRKVLLRELDVINAALQYRLVLWASSLPKRTLEDQLWPTTFSTEERKSIKKYVVDYVGRHDLIGEITEVQQMNAVQALKNDDEFPVAMARSMSVIQAVFLEARLNLGKRSRSQSEATATSAATSRATSPVKKSAKSRDDEIDASGKKRKRKSSAAAADDEFADFGTRHTKRPRTYIPVGGDAQATDDEEEHPDE